MNTIAVKAPPKVPQATPVNPLARLLPVAMVVAAGGMVLLYLGSGTAARNPMYLFFPAMMLVSVLGTLAYGARGTQRSAELDADRRSYLRYLDETSDELTELAAAQRESLLDRHPDPSSLWGLAGGPRMWERRPEDADFGAVRVGIGTGPSSTAIIEPEIDHTDESDPVTLQSLRRMTRARSHVDGVPVTVSLDDTTVLEVGGPGARGLVRAMLCQLATSHDPRLVRVMTVLTPETVEHWDWLKWLPHHHHPYVSDAVGPARLVYRSVDAAQRDISRVDADRVVLLVDGPATPAEMPGVAIVAITTDAGSPGIDASGPDVDDLPVDSAVACARRLACFRPTAGVAANRSWLDLVGAASIQEAPETARRVRPAAGVLRAPIGVDDEGTPVLLDIKESARGGIGPHGLCVGATGSGKSEFLRTLVLGMMAGHRPDELNLALVDFKGGATFLGLDRAPHVSAVITNLSEEAHLVMRMREALAGEMNRRQELLRAAGNLPDVSGYETARRHQRQLPALPALLVVVDEFSELLHQQPDFADLFAAIGRLGRSLGMYLLLASQRLDEGRLRGLESHLSYRICLKTFSAAESRAVLGVPDAYHLPSTPGTALLRTAASDGLVRFRTAYVSGRVPPVAIPERASAMPHAEVFTAAPVGAISVPATDGDGGVVDEATRTVLDTVVDALCVEQPRAHRIWLSPLTVSPTLGALLGPPLAPLSIPIGLVDRPFAQRRDPLVVDLGGAAGNVAIVGGPRAGKSTAVRTLVLGLAATNDSRDVQIHCLDFGGGTLSPLTQLPHIGSVATRSDGDLVRRTVAEIEGILRSREAAGAGRFADVFLVIDGWATIRQDFDVLEAPITMLAARGLSFGIHVVITATRWPEIRPALKDQIGTRVELRLGEPAESEMDRACARRLGQCPPGKGIDRSGDELTIALPRLDGVASDIGLADAIGRAAALVRSRNEGPDTPPIRLLPDHIRYADITDGNQPLTSDCFVIGIDEHELRPARVDFGDQPNMMVLGDTECGKTALLRTLCTDIVSTTDADDAQLLIVDYRRTLLGVVETAHLSGYAMSPAVLTAQLPGLLDTLSGRMPGEDVTQHQLRARSWWSGPDIYVVVDDYDLVAGGTVNPLTPLLDYLPYAKDVGLHMIVARRSGGASRAMFDPLLARIRDLGCTGVMMSADPEDGILLGGVRPRSLPPGRGTLITRTRDHRIIQVAWTDPP